MVAGATDGKHEPCEHGGGAEEKDQPDSISSLYVLIMLGCTIGTKRTQAAIGRL